jgi:D-mannonate dehydratase
VIPTNYQVLAIYNLYPTVGYLRDEVAYDLNDNEVAYDIAAVNVKAAELEASDEAVKQAQVDAKQSALNKLMALGLTEEEALALGVK